MVSFFQPLVSGCMTHRASPAPVNENAGSHGKQVTIQMLDWRSRHLALHSEKDLLHKIVYLASCDALREITPKACHMRFVGGLLRVSDCPLRRCAHRTPHLAGTERDIHHTHSASVDNSSRFDSEGPPRAN